MLEGERMVLEGRMQVGLGRVARVTRLGEQREVGEAELSGQLRRLGTGRRTGSGKSGGVDKGEAEGNCPERDEAEGEGRRPPAHSSFLTVSTTLSTGVPTYSVAASRPSGPTT